MTGKEQLTIILQLASFALSLIYLCFWLGGGALATSIVEQNNDTIRNIFLLSLHYVIRRLALFKTALNNHIVKETLVRTKKVTLFPFSSYFICSLS